MISIMDVILLGAIILYVLYLGTESEIKDKKIRAESVIKSFEIRLKSCTELITYYKLREDYNKFNNTGYFFHAKRENLESLEKLFKTKYLELKNGNQTFN